MDINADGELKVNMFNVTKDQPIKDGKIFMSSIQSAEILLFSHYDVSEELIKKLDEDLSLRKYNFDRYDNNVLNYYLECYRANNDPFLHKTHLIPQIDLNAFAGQNTYYLSDIQQNYIVQRVYNNDYNTFYDYELAFSEFSIDLASRGKFVVAYRKLTYDPVQQTLHLGDETLFNSNFYIKDTKFSLSYYTELYPSDFEELYLKDKSSTIASLKQNFRSGELANTRPEIVVLGYAQIDISKIYEKINTEFSTDNAQVPLRAFFQNMSLIDRKNRKEPQIVLYDENVNIDQLRTIYNSLKYPITYVEGPPGTGKTQTILNIVINCLTNSKTLLITSNNNVPLDGIKDKLHLGNYRGKEIMFPIMRLGNNKYVSEALKKIKELYEFKTKDVPKETLLYDLKEQSKKNNAKLGEKLKNYESRYDLQQNLEFVKKLLNNGGGTNFLLQEECRKIENSIASIPETTDENIRGLFESIKGNHKLLQFFYYESLKYVKRLQTKEFSDLVAILHIQVEEEQIKEFNKWISKDENLMKFTKIFPIIISTNISSRKLGENFKFDLLTIDEAGQSDIATSLIPISKCSNMVLIGDTNQLKPIVVFDESQNQKLMSQFKVEEEYNYFDNSILSAYKQIDNISRDILLSYHYRCGKKIIDYSNKRFYENRLNLSELANPGEVKLLVVNNVNQKEKNAQIEEAKAIVEYIRTNNLSDVFVITPFRNQEKVLNDYLKEAQSKKEIDDSISCGTIHKIQGQENKTIMISTALSKQTSQRTYDWIKNNSQLINVGVTRAKEKLIVVADIKAIDVLSRKDDDLYALIDYVEKNGKKDVSPSLVNKLTIGFSNNSAFENEFYATMSHYCTTVGSKFRRNVKVVEVFPEEKENPLVNEREFDGVLYEGKIPKLVFELNGKEHFSNNRTIQSDKIKMELLKSKNIKLLFIPNHYVKHYEFIRELINKFKGDVYQKTLFDSYDS